MKKIIIIMSALLNILSGCITSHERAVVEPFRSLGNLPDTVFTISSEVDTQLTGKCGRFCLL